MNRKKLTYILLFAGVALGFVALVTFLSIAIANFVPAEAAGAAEKAARAVGDTDLAKAKAAECAELKTVAFYYFFAAVIMLAPIISGFYGAKKVLVAENKAELFKPAVICIILCFVAGGVAMLSLHEEDLKKDKESKSKFFFSSENAMERHTKKQAVREEDPLYKDIDTSKMTLVIAEGRVSAERLERGQKIIKVISTVLVYLFLAVMAVIILLPFYWMLITSLKTTEEIRSDVQTFWPTVVMWSNYSEVFAKFDFVTYLTNTLIVGVLSTIGTLITTIFAAFAFARLEFKGKNVIFAIFLATMMIPGEMMVITNYITVANFGWLGSKVGAFTAMIVPFWVSVFYIYLLRQNFMQIPNELYLAAKVDGKSDWQYLWKVMVPLSAPTLISIFILKLMGAWNSYVWPNLVADRQEWRLITNGLRQTAFQTAAGDVQYGLQMAATVVVTVPLLLLFIFFRKYIMHGVGRAGIKG